MAIKRVRERKIKRKSEKKMERDGNKGEGGSEK